MKVPWVPSTPQSRLPTSKDREVEMAEEALPIPPAPVLPAPPVASATTEPLSEAESKLLEHLRGLRELKALPDQLQPQLSALEERHLASQANRTLTHSHLNRLDKARNQAVSQRKKIHDLDREWGKFMAKANQHLQEHAAHFQRHRSELVAIYQKKLQEWEAVKTEITTASQTCVEQQPAMEKIPDGPQPFEDLQAFFS